MKLIEDKSKIMVFNYTKNYQFTARFHLNEKPLEIVNHTKLLGTYITSDLSWNMNTNYIIRKAYQRMEIIKKLYEFNVPLGDLVHLYCIYVRSILEFNCCVWHFSLTQEQKSDIERVQKNALKIILKQNYVSYENALKKTNLISLEDRRTKLCKTFAQKCAKIEKTKDMFPLDTTRHSNKYQVYFARNDRVLYSAIPQMQRLLNETS